VHDIHDPPGPSRPLDGIWQDGGVITISQNAALSAYLGKLSPQRLNTGDNGLPR